MVQINLIAPSKTVTVSFGLEPAYNVTNTLILLGETADTSGFSEWAYETAEALSPERMRINQLVLFGLDAPIYLDGRDWPSFTAWVDDLAQRDPVQMRDTRLERFVQNAGESLGEEVPPPTQLLRDREAFLTTVDRMQRRKSRTYSHDPSLWQEAHGLLNAPPAMQERMVTHLRAMWDEAMAADWEQNLPMLEESVDAYESLDLAHLSIAGAVRRVTGREFPTEWEDWQDEIDRIIFIPSAHIGPYLMMMNRDGGVLRLAFGARVPEGVPARSPALSRSELLMRLNALADDTRMRILQLLAEKGELSTPEIMAELDLSQSAASRHLHQLSATGYLTAERREGTKVYRLNPTRLVHTCEALKSFCCP